jgi:hypothetical protein
MNQTDLLEPIKDMFKWLNLENHQIQKLLLLKEKKKNASLEAVVNFLNKRLNKPFKVYKLLEYQCEDNKGYMKNKWFRSPGTVNKRKQLVSQQGGVTRCVRASLLVGSISEIVTKKKVTGVISVEFCEHYFVSNLGCITNTSWPTIRNSPERLIAKVQQKINVGPCMFDAHDCVWELVYRERYDHSLSQIKEFSESSFP